IAGQNDAALQAYLRAVQLLEMDRRQIEDEPGRMTFLENKVAWYHAAVRHHLQGHEFAEAFDLMERSRARVLADLLASRVPGYSKLKDRELDAQYRQLEAEIGKLQGDLFDATSEWPRRDATAIAELERRIGDREAERRRLLDRMAREAP